jgi:choline dehydrogenase
MVFVRGHRSSHDAWPAAGAHGWGFDDLLPYFRRSERTDGRDPALRGVDGPLTVGPAKSPHPLAAAGLSAALEVGHPAATDVTGGLEAGFGWSDLTIANGRRVTASDAYLTSAVLNRPNLELVTDALVHRVLVERGDCAGVVYSVGTKLFSVECRGEVVLSAGTVGSSLLLMRSGIGPQSHLREVGIDVVADLEGVGQNLHDHPFATVVYRSARPVPAAANGHGETLGLIRTDPALEAPDVQIMVIDVPLSVPALPGPDQGYALMVSLMAPRSRGSVRLQTAEPHAAPKLDPNYLSDPRDLDTMLLGLEHARAIGRATALNPWRAAEVHPGSDVGDDENLRAFIRKSLQTYHHPVGTCRIGEDDMAVVDTDLRVRGVGGLRVADASVMPSIVSGNTMATVYAIAERAAALINESAVTPEAGRARTDR